MLTIICQWRRPRYIGGLVLPAVALLVTAFPAMLHSQSPMQLVGDEAVVTWLKLKGDLSGQLTYEWVRGSATGITADALSTPLFQIESVTIRNVQRLDSGGWREQTYACRLYRDITSGDFVDEFQNPYTGKTVALQAKCSPGPDINYKDGIATLPGFDGFNSSAVGTPMTLTMQKAGDQTVFQRQARSAFGQGDPRSKRYETALDTFVVPTVDSADDARSSLKAAYNWTSVTQWMGILGMGDRAGHMLWNVNGYKFATPQELPVEFRMALEREVPGALEYAFE
jgi:hypothetical protein